LNTLHILVVGTDPNLAAELEAAARGLDGYVAVVSAAPDLLRAAEAARDLRPHVVLLPLLADPEDVAAFSRQLRAAGVAPLLLGLCAPSELDGEGGRLLSALRGGVKDFLRRPLSSAELRQAFERHLGDVAAAGAGIGRTIAFVSNKGGIGKSTLAVSTACALAARHPDRVLLIDASLQLGVCASMLDLEPEASLADAARERERLDETLLRQLAVRHACGLRLLGAPPDAVEATAIDDRAIGRILGVGKRAFDFVIVDTFPLLDAVALAILDLSDRIEIVTGPAVPHVLGAAKLLQVLDRMAVPRARQEIVLNDTHPPHRGKSSLAAIEERLERPIAHAFPFERKLLAALDLGEPYALHASRHFGFGKALHRLVLAIEQGAVAPRGVPA
jgi:pilus assembly protein CpaE